MKKEDGENHELVDFKDTRTEAVINEIESMFDIIVFLCSIEKCISKYEIGC